MPRTIVLLDTETTGLSNHQADSTAGFGLLQLSALKFRLDDGGALTYVAHLNLAVEPDVPLIDPASGQPRLPFYDDYAATATGQAYAHACEGEMGVFCGVLSEDGAFIPHASADARRGYLRAILDPWQKDDATPATRGERLLALLSATLDRQAAHFHRLGDHAAADARSHLKAAMEAEFRASPHLIEHIDNAFYAAHANGIRNRAQLLEKANAFGQPELIGYQEACRRFAAFYEGAECMAAHNAAYDYAVLARLFHEAKRAGMAVPPFPLAQDAVVDTQLLSAVLPERYGKRTGLGEWVRTFPLTVADIYAIGGLDAAAVARILHQPEAEGPILHRLDADRADSLSGVAHDGMEDTLILAGALARLAPHGLATMAEAAATLPGVDGPARTGREALEAAGLSARDTGTGYALWLPLEPHSAPGRLFRHYLMVKDRDSVNQGFPPATLAAPPEGVLLNLQRLAYYLCPLVPLLKLAEHPAVADAALDPGSRYGNKSFLNLTLADGRSAGATLADWIASAAAFSWHDADALAADIALLARVREGMRARPGADGGIRVPAPTVELDGDRLRIRHDPLAAFRVLPLAEGLASILGPADVKEEGNRIVREFPREALTRAMLEGALDHVLPPLPPARRRALG